jgi:hypothetical protein
VTIIADPKANKVDLKKSKAQVIQKGGKVRQERPKQKAEMIKL